MYGRRKILTDYSVITMENVREVLYNALTTHQQNQIEIEKLYRYYKGEQNILNKVKDIRENINHKVCVNLANYIVNFKVGYVLGEPIQYIRRGDSVSVDELNSLNDYMVDANKPSADRDLAEWVNICGVGYRMELPREPLEIYTLDPRYTFVVYENGLGEKPVMAVKFVQSITNHKDTIYSIYTENMYFEVVGDRVTKAEPHSLGKMPIIEYVNNATRLGSFEVVLDLLDAVNSIESNRLDDVVQFVNSFLCISGATLDEETFNAINTYKMLGLPEGSDAKYLSATLNQTDVQTLKDDLYKAILMITGLPNRGDGKGGSSDNGVAVYLREGHADVETQALSFELNWKKSERQFLELTLRILKDLEGISIKPHDIEIKFARRYTDNILTKVQAMIQMLDAGVAPNVAFATSGIWNDANSVYEESKPYLEKWSVDNDVRDNGQDIEETQIEDME